MKLKELGYNSEFERYRTTNNLQNFETGRIISEHRERYIVRTEKGEYEAEITGNMRFSAQSREDFPAVGDWVSLTCYDANSAIIHHIFPRFSCIKRQAVGHFGEVQLIAANIDHAFLVQAADRDFNINRLERYLTICNASRVSPIIILSKTDLQDEQSISQLVENIKSRIKNIVIIAISSATLSGYNELKASIEPGKTYCLLGSSGVGKSTLLNTLSDKSIMRTEAISQSTSKGRHVTSHRELQILENGGILIDNPGMREVGIADSAGGLEITFDSIKQLSQQCRFKDCTHTTEAGCSVIESVEKGETDRASYENYLRMEREKAWFDASLEERRKKDKQFGKFMHNYKKDMRRNEF